MASVTEAGKTGSEQGGIAQKRRAADISLTITGKKQGKFKGGTLKKERKDQFDIWEASYSAVSPRDAASGQATGRRQHNPLVVFGEVVTGVPMLFKALIENETLTKVTLDYWRSSKEGKQSIYFTIELEDAVISELEIFSDEDGRPNYRAAFTFSSITATWKEGNITATDTWMGTT